VVVEGIRDPRARRCAAVSVAKPVSIRAHAKINLDLRVLGTRADGYHELRTVFQAIALHDVVECVPEEGAFAIECTVPGVPLDESNLVWRAAQALWHALRRPGPVRGVTIRLQKGIPLQSGLGGGSSDAAAALRALATLWRTMPSATWRAAARVNRNTSPARGRRAPRR
jgi:4-diphosphocytidyl-2-C-methyl-D-erythritol kinase